MLLADGLITGDWHLQRALEKGQASVADHLAGEMKEYALSKSQIDEAMEVAR